jgi:hypothetical protein
VDQPKEKESKSGPTVKGFGQRGQWTDQRRRNQRVDQTEESMCRYRRVDRRIKETKETKSGPDQGINVPIPKSRPENQRDQGNKETVEAKKRWRKYRDRGSKEAKKRPRDE